MALVPVSATNQYQWSLFPALSAAEKGVLVPVLGINRYQCQPLVPVGAINRDQLSGYITPCLRARRSHLAICRSSSRRRRRRHRRLQAAGIRPRHRRRLLCSVPPSTPPPRFLHTDVAAPFPPHPRRRLLHDVGRAPLPDLRRRCLSSTGE